MIKRETAEEFIERLNSLPEPDTTDKKTMRAFIERLDKFVRHEIEEQDQLQARSLSRAFTKVVR